jgi:hypothetical protein
MVTAVPTAAETNSPAVDRDATVAVAVMVVVTKPIAAAAPRP